MSTAIHILGLCAKAGKYIEARQLYKAFRVLEGLQRDYGAVLRGPHDARWVGLWGDAGSGTMGELMWVAEN